MAGIIPLEGRLVRGRLIWKGDFSLRAANLELGLFTNTEVDEEITAADITEPEGGGYSRITLIDGEWQESEEDAEFTFARQTFEAVGGGMTGTIRGYFIMGYDEEENPYLLAIEEDPMGPITLDEEGYKYHVTPKIKE